LELAVRHTRAFSAGAIAPVGLGWKGDVATL
jgi:hypothetical protein